MDVYRSAGKKERNAEAVRRHREKKQREENEMNSIYEQNEKKIKVLEKKVRNLEHQMKQSPKNKSSHQQKKRDSS